MTFSQFQVHLFQIIAIGINWQNNIYNIYVRNHRQISAEKT